MYKVVYSKSRKQVVGAYVVILAVIAFAAIQLQGCAQLGTPVPQGTEQSIAYLYPAIGSVADETTSLLQAGKIKKSEAQNVLTILEQLRGLTNVAKDYVKAGDEGKATATLDLAKGLLKQAQNFITTKKGN